MGGASIEDGGGVGGVAVEEAERWRATASGAPRARRCVKSRNVATLFS